MNMYLNYLLIFLSCFSLLQQRLIAEEPTSIADLPEYRQICLEASIDDVVFANFKSYPAYKQILEHVTYDLGLEYLNIIKQKYPGLLSKLESFKMNDMLGNPTMYTYDIGTFSPSTLRYIKVAGDLMSLLPNMNSMKIVEIGAGYGGQCKILSDLISFREYVIVDLPEPLALAKKYLEILNVKRVRFVTPEQLKAEEYDLAISNYAFSECNRTYQTEYLNKIIKNSRFGYMTMNYIPFPFQEKPYTISELITFMIKNPLVNVRLLPEEPLTSPKNVIFTWRTK